MKNWNCTTKICKTWNSPLKRNKLYLLQTRNGKKPASLYSHCVEMEQEGLIDDKTAIKRIDPAGLPSLLANVFNEEKLKLNRTWLRKWPCCRSGAYERYCFNCKKLLSLKRCEKYPLEWRLHRKTLTVCTRPKGF